MYVSHNHESMADECMCLLPPACLAGLDRFHVRDAVRLAGADRIGHGVALQWEDDSKGTLKYMADNKVCVTAGLQWLIKRTATPLVAAGDGQQG